MKRNYCVLSFLLVFVLSLCFMTSSASATTEKWVTNGSLRMRTSMSTSSSDNVLFSIPNHMPVDVLSTSGAWSRITFNGYTGYVMSQYLTDSSFSAHPETKDQSFGGKNLQYGMTNDLFVYNLQICLRYSGDYSGAPTGNFDSATLTAVRNYQAAHSLTVDGIVGNGTKTSLWNLYGGGMAVDGVKRLPQ